MIPANLISLGLLLLLTRSCINIAIEPIETYDEALSIDLRMKPCTITVNLPDQLSNTANSAQQGDVICLLPGVFYPPLNLIENTTRANTTEYIIIRVNDVNVLPPPGIRISTAYESDLPKIDGRTHLEGTNINDRLDQYLIVLNLEVHHFAFLGVDFYSQTASGFNIELVSINATTRPHHVIMDQCLFRSSEALVAATTFSGQFIALLNSHITSNAAISTTISGASVVTIQNNYYDVERLFIAVQQLDALAMDIQIRYNRFEKRGSTINYYGFYMSQFERLLFENNYVSPSRVELNITSDLVLFLNDGPSNQRDFIFRNNWVENFGRGFIIYPLTNWTGSVATEYSIYHNFLKEGKQVMPYTSGTAVNFTQNTILNGRGDFFAVIEPQDPSYVSLNFERNIIEAGFYGIVTQGFKNVVDSVGAQNWNWQDNLVITSTYLQTFPNTSLMETNMTDVGFVDMDQNNYNLLPSSKYSKENYGVQLGVDICQLINTARLKVVVPGCPLDSVELQPSEVITVTTDVVINGNLTMYPNSTLQVPFDDGKLNVSNCANFAGVLSLANTTDAENGTEVILAYYGCSNGGKFDQVTLVDGSDDECLLKYVNLTYAPTSLSAIITLVDTCSTPEQQSQQPFPGWAIAVIVVGGCLVLVAVFIVVSITVPSLRQKVFPYARRPGSVSQRSSQS